MDSCILEAKAYASKLEVKLAGGSGGQYVAEKYEALRTRARALKQRSEEQAEVIASQEVSLEKSVQEIEVLTRALEIRADEIGVMGRGTGTGSSAENVRGGLLLELAQSRHKNQLLAAEVASAEGKAANAQEQLANLEGRYERAAGLLKAQVVNLRAYEEWLTASTQLSQDLEQQLKQAEDDKAQLLGTVENLQEQLSTAEMQAKSIADESDATITSLRSELTEVHRNCANLRRQLGDAEEHRDRIIQVQSLTEERLAREHGGRTASWRAWNDHK